MGNTKPDRESQMHTDPKLLSQVQGAAITKASSAPSNSGRAKHAIIGLTADDPPQASPTSSRERRQAGRVQNEVTQHRRKIL